jgi:hypothetical protein
MFEQLAASAIEPELLKILRLAKQALLEVRQRQNTLSGDKDHVTALVANQVLAQLDAWQPALDVMIAGLEPKPAPPAQALRLPPGHGH